MSRKLRKLSTDVFDAVSAPTRINALRLLNSKGPLSYSELMEMLDLEPSKDAGKFVYHLRNLISAGLMDVDTKTKKYRITELGVILVDFSQSIEEYALKKSGKLLVRTSRYAIEEFDRGKIAAVLVEEAGVPAELAEKIAGEAEERLLRLQTRYLTAPLIREFVNAILIEKGLEDYRHKLTRLGVPVYDVTRTLNRAAAASRSVAFVQNAAAQQVMTEYMLLDALPREIADAHLSGLIHICNPADWVLKPHSVYHDLRVFLSQGLRIDKANMVASSTPKPRTFAGGLALLCNVVEAFNGEVSGEQTLDNFTTFLAPYVQDEESERVKELLHGFLAALSLKHQNFPHTVTLGLDVGIPDNLRDKPAIVAENGPQAPYGHFEDASLKLLEALTETAVAMGRSRPVFSPRFVVKVNEGNLSGQHDGALRRVHELAAQSGCVLIANMAKEWQEFSSYSGEGERIETDWTEDWEVDTVRTGCLDNVALNLPRIAYEARRNDDRFFNELNKAFALTRKAFEVKQKIIDERVKQGLLPCTSSQVNGEEYYRVQHALRVVSTVGLNEAVKFHIGHQLHEDTIALNFGLRVIEELNNAADEAAKETKTRFVISQVSDVEAGSRLAKLDTEKYGKATVFTQGEKDMSHYTTGSTLPKDLILPLNERLRIAEKFHPLMRGGHLSLIQLHQPAEAERLLEQTKNICENTDVGLFAYGYALSFCGQCQKTFVGHLPRCTGCGGTLLIHYDWEGGGYTPSKWRRSLAQGL